MSSAAGARSPATLRDLLAIPEEDRFHEIIDGELVRKAMPSGEHADAQSALALRIKGPFQRRPGGGSPLVLAAGREARVHAEPFEAIELPVAALFGDDEA